MFVYLTKTTIAESSVKHQKSINQSINQSIKNNYKPTVFICTITINIFCTYSGRDRIVVGCTTTYAISAYHHYRCEFESNSGEVHSMQTYCDKVCQ